MVSSSLPKVAVLLAAFNGIKWLREQTSSILDQFGINVTLFISVDKSSDGTEQFVDSLAMKDERVVVLPHNFVFGGAAKNFYRLLTEVDFSEFDYVGLSDQDDIWKNDKIHRAIQSLVDGGYQGYSSNVMAFWAGRDSKVLIDKAQPQRQWDYLFEAAGPGCTYLMTKGLANCIQDCISDRPSAVREIGLHDWLIYAIARARGFHWYIDHKVGLLYRQHESNQVGVNQGVSASLKRIKMFVSGYWFEQSLRVADIAGVSGSDFVRRWQSLSFWGLVRLSFSARKCRRRFRDQVTFFVLCLITGFLIGFRRR